MSRLDALDILAFLPSGLTVGQARQIIGSHDDAICRHCGRHVVDFSGQWVHSRGSRSCRSASFDADGDWDKSLRPSWHASRGGQAPVDNCHACELLSGDSEQPSPDLRDGAGRPISWEQRQAWVIAQAIRNRLEAFHGGGAVDPDNPDSGDGFISDNQMRALNIVIRRAVHEALACLCAPIDDRDAGRFVQFQLAMVHDYMEPPGSPELEHAYDQVTRAG
jgi:hypothetical protein